VKSLKPFVGILAALVLVAGGLYGIQQLRAGENCPAHSQATAEKTDAKVETANATTTTGTCCAKSGMANATATGATCCAAKSGTVNAEKASATTAQCPHDAKMTGAQCAYNAKTGTAQCTGADKATLTQAGGEVQLWTAQTTMTKLAHCGIDCRNVKAEDLAAMLVQSGCGAYTQAQWTTMIKSAQALDAKEAQTLYTSACSDKSCSSQGCPMSKVAAELAAAQNTEKKGSSD
jgi:hypothetical protein